MGSEKLAYNILRHLGIAVLQRSGPRQYVILGDPPPFYRTLFPSEGEAPCTEPWQHSPMLDFFIGDVEQFFDNGAEGVLSSGIWQEDGKTDSNSAMIAFAMAFDEAQVLIVRMLQEDFRERAGVLCKARELLLEQRNLAHNLNIFKKKSRLDGLTQVFNNVTFWDLLHDDIKRSQELNYPLSLLLLDIDDFKKVNDTYGHLAGDHVLRSLGALLLKTLRRNDIVARYGGEEFVVILPHETQKMASRIAEKLRQSIASMQFPDIPSITVSIGCVTYACGESAESFLIRADNAMYDAKKCGKNMVCQG